MAGGGVPEAMLIGAAVGAGTGGVMAAAKDQDPLQGALLGAAMGAAGGGIGSAVGGAASGAATGTAGGTAGGTTGGTVGGTVGGEVGGTVGGGVGGEVGGGGAGAVASTAEASAAQTGALDAMTRAGLSFDQQASIIQGAQGAGSTAPGMGSMTNAGMDFAQQQQVYNAFQPGSMTTQPTGGVSDLAQWGQAGKGTGFAPSLTNAQAYGAGIGGAGMGAVGQSSQDQNNMAPEPEPYTGPLSKFNYSPSTFRPSVAPGYADGGIMSLGRQTGMYPQSQMDRTQFAVPSQMPTSREVIGADYDATINPYTGDMPRFAHGGISNLGSYSDGGRMLRGPGDGMSDDIPGVIAGKQPARLADGEFVVPADVVSHLGNGSTDAGAKKLYSMMDNVRKARTGSKKQGRQIKAEKHMPAMARGGIAYYDDGGETSSEEAPAEQPAATTITGQGATSTAFQPSGYTPSADYTPYTMANRPSSTAPQNYGNIYQGAYQDYSTPGYTLAGNLGQWSNVAGEQARAAQPASLNQQVTQSYLRNLGRAPDQATFDEYMQSGLTGQQINRAIGASGEAVQANPANQSRQDSYIADLYRQYLGRDPEATGLSGWSQTLSQGPTGSLDVMRGIVNSPEAQIRQAYQTYLGRDPESAGTSAWANAMQQGMTAAQMRAAVQSSNEARARAARQTSGGISTLV